MHLSSSHAVLAAFLMAVLDTSCWIYNMFAWCESPKPTMTVNNSTHSRKWQFLMLMLLLLLPCDEFYMYELNAIAPTWLPKSHSPTAIKATKCWIYSLHTHTVWSMIFFLVFSREWNFQHFMKCSLLFLFLNSSWCWFALIFAVESFFNSSQLFNTFGLQKK